MLKKTLAIGMTLVLAATFVAAQGERVASPDGASATQLGENGKWIEITAGRPIKRGRDLWGNGANYGKTLLTGNATVWRAGANVSTRLKTEAPLEIGGKTVPAGEYSLFIDAQVADRLDLDRLVVGAQRRAETTPGRTRSGGRTTTPPTRTSRASPMKVDKLPVAIDQLTWNFADVTPGGGKLVLMWDTVVATAPFTVAKSTPDAIRTTEPAPPEPGPATRNPRDPEPGPTQRRRAPRRSWRPASCSAGWRASSGSASSPTISGSARRRRRLQRRVPHPQPAAEPVRRRALSGSFIPVYAGLLARGEQEEARPRRARGLRRSCRSSPPSWCCSASLAGAGAHRRRSRPGSAGQTRADHARWSGSCFRAPACWCLGVVPRRPQQPPQFFSPTRRR